jgi:regulator of protease activity HflC (stomatin/prohibitin superfamily)
MYMQKRSHLVSAGLACFFVLSIFFGSFYIVQPNEVAMIRRLGTVIPGIVHQGIHLKIPFIDTVDPLPISIQRFSFNKTIFFSSDNQTIELALSVTYRIPESAVPTLLYGMGRAGSADIAANLQPIISQRLREVVGRQNIQSFNQGMDKFTQDVRAAILSGVGDWVQIIDVQIADFDLAPSFKASNEQAMKAKNDALAAEYTLKKVEATAKQAKAQADGEAAAITARAKADAEAKVLAANAEAEAIRVKGVAEAEALNLKAKVLAGNPQVTVQTWAEKWSGQVPSTVMGQGQNIIPMIPLPAAK